jgi:hypothetical protein
MGHSIRWDNEDKTVLLHEFVAPASKDDLYQLAQKSAAILQKVAYTVHLIVDQRKFNVVFDSADFVFLNNIRPANEGAVMVIVSPLRIKYAAAFQELGRKVGQKTFSRAYSVESPEEARQRLREKFNVRYP